MSASASQSIVTAPARTAGRVTGPFNALAFTSVGGATLADAIDDITHDAFAYGRP